MNDLFKILWNKIPCQRNGVCSTNPMLWALDIVIINEIKQIAFYIVRLKELNFTNTEIMKETVMALSTNISDTNFNHNSFKNFYSNLINIKEKTKEFYLKKCNELNIPYEVVNENSDNKNFDINNLIKTGENIINSVYNKLENKKLRLINIIFLICRLTSINLLKLTSYKKINEYYFYEILKLLNTTNFISTREEKLKRKIKEFSIYSYEIQKELTYELKQNYGKKETSSIKTKIIEGKSVLVVGEDLDELFNLLEKTKNENINVYVTPFMVDAFLYPKFKSFKNLIGIYGTYDVEKGFSNFVGPIYVTRNSTIDLDTAFRGKIFSTKLIPNDKSIPITTDNLNKLIDEIKNSNGFIEEKEGREFLFEYDFEKIDNFANDNKENITIALGISNEREDIDLIYPNEIELLYYAIEKLHNKKLEIKFQNCTAQIINTIISILEKNYKEISLCNCSIHNVNPHITDSLKNDFNIKIL